MVFQRSDTVRGEWDSGAIIPAVPEQFYLLCSEVGKMVSYRGVVGG